MTTNYKMNKKIVTFSTLHYETLKLIKSTYICAYVIMFHFGRLLK